MSRPYISVAVPVYDMPNGEFFLDRLKESLGAQTFRDFELVITKDGKMAENTNAAIRKSTGKLIKILYQDDYLNHESALADIADAFQGHWLITGSDNNLHPHWTDDIEKGNNKLGSPSALTVLNEEPLLFDENMSYLLDCDYYRRMYDRYGAPVILDKVGVSIGVGPHQTTNLLTNEEKQREFDYMYNKYKA